MVSAFKLVWRAVLSRGVSLMHLSGVNDFGRDELGRRSAFVIGPCEVHVWIAELELRGSVDSFLATLAPDEHTRAGRFRFPLHRNRFIATRAVRRKLLANYLNRSPGELQFVCNSNGKPALAGDNEWLHFNVSHSAGLALYAISREREVGIDVERLRPDMRVEDIAERYFSPQELAEFRDAPSTERVSAFFNCWTRKEAYVKALGTGLSVSLQEFSVPVTGYNPISLLDVQRRDWLLRPLELGPEYAAAVVGEGKDWNLRLWKWPAQE